MKRRRTGLLSRPKVFAMSVYTVVFYCFAPQTCIQPFSTLCLGQAFKVKPSKETGMPPFRQRDGDVVPDTLQLKAAYPSRSS